LVTIYSIYGIMAHLPIQNSVVYVLNSTPVIQALPTSAPPSPPTPCESGRLSPIPGDILPISPPELEPGPPKSVQRLASAVHVLQTEAIALSCLTKLYQTDSVAREGFHQAVDVITTSSKAKGKIVICGVGKSGHIAKKLVATMNSLKIHSTYLHPTEALHGDLGKVREDDVILLITFSGRTPELLQLIPHFNPKLPLVVMTSHTSPTTCEISKQWPQTILLPSPIHESETLSFGVSAPTTSTTMALALGDALAVAISNELHPSVSDVFLRNHPGGAIGATIKGPQKLSDLTVPYDSIPHVNENFRKPAQGVHIIMAGYQSPSGWVQCEHGVVPPRKIGRLQPDDMNLDAKEIDGLVVPLEEWIEASADLDVGRVIEWISNLRDSIPCGDHVYSDDAVVAAIVDGEISGLVEVGTIMKG